MTGRIVFQGGDLDELRRRLLADAPLEAAAALVVVPGRTMNGTRLIVRAVLVAAAQDYSERSSSRVTLTPAFIARALKRARLDGGGVILVHTHPMQGVPAFSVVDDAARALLAPVLHGRSPGPHGFLVLGTKGFRGEIFSSRGDVLFEVSLLQEVGRRVTTYAQHSDAEVLEAFFDRNIRALGREGQLALRALNVGVVGVGGTGSVVVEELARLGVGTLTVIDPEPVEETNLNRLLGARSGDVGRSKVSVAGTSARRARADVQVREIADTIIEERAWRALLDCDFVMCCTDSHGSRAVLNQLAYQYRLPMIDIGVRIDARDGVVTGMSTRVQMLAEPLACLNCSPLLDPVAIRRDLLGDKSTDRYIVGTYEPQPAVISINAASSSTAVSMFLSAVVGFPGNARHLIGRPIDGVVRAVSTPRNDACIVCAPQYALARGDTWPMLAPSR